MVKVRIALVLIAAAVSAVGCKTDPSIPSTVAGKAPVATADTELEDFHLRALETRIQTMPQGPERDYFSGMLAARSGQFDDAIRLITSTLPHLRENEPKRAALALASLGTSYLATNRYGDASRTYGELSERFASQLKHFPSDDAAYVRILSNTPPQTIEWQGPVRLATSRNPLGSINAELTINGAREQWLLDTGANQSVVTRTFATRLGLTPLPGSVPVGSGITGIKSPVQVGVLPTMTIGGAVLKNVPLLIFEDEKLRIGFGTDAYQINAILGYPILKALGTVTFTRTEFRAGDAAEKNVQGARMYMRDLAPAIECEVEGRPLIFTFDTGATTSDLSVRYYEEFRQQARSWKTQTIMSGGAGGSRKLKAYSPPAVTLKVGASTVTLKGVSVLPRMNAGIDTLFGNLGQDLVAEFDSFSLDFVKMVFSLGPAVK